MQGKFAKIVMGLIALAMTIGFFLPPVIKLKNPSMIIVILIGVAAMVYNFIEVVREKDGD
jgi:F0F1-type ATP synthase assembly protein I